MWCARPGCKRCCGSKMQAGRLHHEVGGERLKPRLRLFQIWGLAPRDWPFLHRRVRPLGAISLIFEKRTYSFEFRSEQVIGGQFSVFSVQFSVRRKLAPRPACCPCESDIRGHAASGSCKSRPITVCILGGFGWLHGGKRVLHNFAHSRTCLHKPTQFRHMPAQARTCPHMPARPWNRDCRRTSRCTDGTYIVGYAPASYLDTRVSSAWTSIAKRLKSNDLRTGPSLSRRPTLREKSFFRF